MRFHGASILPPWRFHGAFMVRRGTFEGVALPWCFRGLYSHRVVAVAVHIIIGIFYGYLDAPFGGISSDRTHERPDPRVTAKNSWETHERATGQC